MRFLGKTILVIAVFVAVGLLIYPNVIIDTGEKLFVCNYNGDFSEYDVNHSYNEIYCYNEEYDISIKTFDVRNHIYGGF